MSKSSLLFCLAALGFAAGGALAQNPQPPTFLEALGVRLVNVEALVSDKAGSPVVDLQLSDFELREDGKKVKITHFEGPGGPAVPQRAAQGEQAERMDGWVVLLVDNFGVSPLAKRRVLESAKGFVAKNLGSGLHFAIASYDGYLEVRQTFTENEAQLMAALDGLEGLSALGLARQSDRWSSLRESLNTLSRIESLTRSPEPGTDVSRHLNSYLAEVRMYADRVRRENSSVFYALSHMVNALGALPGRKALVYVSEGLPMRPGEEFLQAGSVALRDLPQDQRTGTEARHTSINQRSAQLGALSDMGSVTTHGRATENPKAPPGLRQLTASANSNRVSIYTLKSDGHAGGVPAEFGGDSGRLYTPAVQSVRDQNLLETMQVMASETGGDARVGTGVDGLLGRALSDMDYRYSLAFAPDRPADGEYHELKLKVKRKGVKVRHRTGYLDKTIGAKLADRATTSLLLGIDDNPHGLRLELGEVRPGAKQGEVEVALILHIPLRDVGLVEQAGVWIAETQLFVAARDAAGDAAPVQALGLRIEVARSPEEEPEQVFSGQLPLVLRRGDQRVGLALVDPGTGAASFVSTDLKLGS